MLVRIYLVRHACAGRKEDWPGPDDERPLDAAGHQQAEALARELRGTSIARLLASPTLRCRETLQPLSDAIGLPIETSSALAIDGGISSFTDLDQVVTEDDTVMCTHGEVLSRLLEDARTKQAQIETERSEDDWLLLKGSTWILEVDGGQPRIDHRAPLPIPECPRHTHLEAAPRSER